MFLKNAIKKYGKSNFILEVLEHCDSLETLNEREIHWIETLDSRNPEVGYNVAKRGNGLEEVSYRKARGKMKGRPFSQEHKENISKAKKGKPTKPVIFSKESKLKMSESGKKKFFSDEHRANMSKSRKGRPTTLGKKWSEETRRKILEARKHVINPRAFVLEIVNIGSKEVMFFKSANSARLYFKCNIQTILNNKLKNYQITRK